MADSRTEAEPLLTPTTPAQDHPSPAQTLLKSAVAAHRTISDDVYPETSTLGRTLTWRSAYILTISRVLGSGIFATPGVILRSVGSPGLALSLWLLGAVVAACGLSISLEYGCMLPRSGGHKVYLEYTYPRPRFLASTIVAVNAVLLGFTASNCVVFARYVCFAFDVEPTDGVRKTLAVTLLTVITVIHGCFYKAGIKIQNVLGWVKVGLIVFMIAVGLFVVLFRENSHVRSTGGGLGWDGLWQDSNWNKGVLATSLFKVFYSYAGLENVNNVLNEVKDPVQTLKSASRTALVTACVLYMLINVAYLLVLPLEDIKKSGELVAGLFFERIFGEHVGKRILPLTVAVSGAGNVMVVTFALARLNQEIARQGFLPFSRLLSSSKPFNAPLGGLIVHYIPSFLVIVLPPSNEVYSFILEVEGYPAQFFALAISFGLVWLRFKRPDLKRPFKAWLPAVFFRIASSFSLLSAPFFAPREARKDGLWYATYAVVGTSVTVFGFLYWLVWIVLLPRWKGYRIEEQDELLDDGTAITKLVHVPKQS